MSTLSKSRFHSVTDEWLHYSLSIASLTYWSETRYRVLLTQYYLGNIYILTRCGPIVWWRRYFDSWPFQGMFLRSKDIHVRTGCSCLCPLLSSVEALTIRWLRSEMRLDFWLFRGMFLKSKIIPWFVRTGCSCLCPYFVPCYLQWSPLQFADSGLRCA